MNSSLRSTPALADDLPASASIEQTSNIPRAAEVHHLSAATPLAQDAALIDVLEALRLRFQEGATRHDREASFPFENFGMLRRHGLIGAVVPASHGGGGAQLSTARRIISAVAQGEPSTALVLTMTYLVHRSISRADSRWPAHVRDAVYRSALIEGALANSLRVEPALGSPARGGLPETVARRTPDGWRMDGHKLYTTGIPGLTWLAVWARTDDEQPQVGTFLVPRDAPGIRVVESWDHLGLRASGSHEVIFEDVPLPLDHAVDIRPAAEWAKGQDADQYAWMITLLGALYDGVARAARAWVLDFVNERAPGSLGAPLATLPRVQQIVGEIETLLHANDALLEQLVGQTERGEPPSAIRSGLVKYTVTNNAIQVVDLALQLSGNRGLSRANPLERHHRDVLCSRIHTPQNDSILIGAGQLALLR